MRFPTSLTLLLCVYGTLAVVLPRSFESVTNSIAEIRSKLDHLKLDAVAVESLHGTDEEARLLLDGVDNLGAALATAAKYLDRTEYTTELQYLNVWDASRALEAPTNVTLNEIISKADSFPHFRLLQGPFPALMARSFRTMVQKARSFDHAALSVNHLDDLHLHVGSQVEYALESLKGVCKILGVACN